MAVDYDELGRAHSEIADALHALTLIARMGSLRYLVWGSMLYACHGHRPGDDPRAESMDACGWRSRVHLCVGVEGPPPLRESAQYVAAPFSVRCPECGGTAMHIDWALDEDLGECRTLYDVDPDWFFIVTPSGAQFRRGDA